MDYRKKYIFYYTYYILMEISFSCFILFYYLFIIYGERKVLLFINVILLHYNGASYSNSLFNFIVSNARIFCD